VRDREAIAYHYDVSNDFYALWLDKKMIYSCGYFENGDEDIGTTQNAKLEYICRKLRLKPGERLLDIGCGRGGLVVHAARKYGVRALGITLSRAQMEHAQTCIHAAGLSDRCEVRLLDYRDLRERGAYEKIVSVGMVEHMGAANLAEYFCQAFRLLRAGGLFLNSGISRPGNRRPSPEPTFTDIYIFSDGELVTIATLLDNAEQAGFEVREVESLRDHYHLTVRHWLQRLEARAPEARQIVSDRTYRTWRLYLAGSAYYFQKAFLNLYQTLLEKADRGESGVPLSRED